MASSRRRRQRAQRAAEDSRFLEGMVKAGVRKFSAELGLPTERPSGARGRETARAIHDANRRRSEITWLGEDEWT